METILNLPSLDTFIIAETRMGAYHYYASGHISIESAVRNPIFGIGSDITACRIFYDKPYKVFLIGMSGGIAKAENR